MSIRPYEGNTFAYALAAVPADPSAPTVAELTAGVLLEPAMTADGLSPSHTENIASVQLLSGFIPQAIGTEGEMFDLKFVIDPDTVEISDVYDFFDERGKLGALVVLEAPAAIGVTGAVYPCSFGRRKRVASAPDTIQQFTVKCAVNQDWTDDAVIAA